MKSLQELKQMSQAEFDVWERESLQELFEDYLDMLRNNNRMILDELEDEEGILLSSALQTRKYYLNDLFRTMSSMDECHLWIEDDMIGKGFGR